MLKIKDLKNDEWLNSIHYTLNLSQRKNKVHIILQAFIEVEVSNHVYTFVQQACITPATYGYLAAVGRLIAGLRLQAAIALWRAKDFHDLKTCKYNGSAVLVIPKSEYPIALSPKIDFVNSKILSCLRDSVIKRAEVFDRFSSYPYRSISEGSTAASTLDRSHWNLLNYAFEERIINWFPHISKSESVNSIFTAPDFEFFSALKKYGNDLRYIGIEPELVTHAEAQEIVKREEVYTNMELVTKRLGVPKSVTNAQLEAEDARRESKRPTTEQYEKNVALEVNEPSENDTLELAKPMRNEIIEMPDTRRLALVRQGVNDIEIEVYRSGDWIPTYLSDLRAGEFFLVAQQSPYGELPANRCFCARGGVRVIPSYNKGNDPSFIVQGMEIVTAPSTSESNRPFRSQEDYQPDGTIRLLKEPNSDLDEVIRSSTPAALLFNTKPETPSN